MRLLFESVRMTIGTWDKRITDPFSDTKTLHWVNVNLHYDPTGSSVLLHHCWTGNIPLMISLNCWCTTLATAVERAWAIFDRTHRIRVHGDPIQASLNPGPMLTPGLYWSVRSWIWKMCWTNSMWLMLFNRFDGLVLLHCGFYSSASFIWSFCQNHGDRYKVPEW